MKIAIDARVIESKMTGIGRYLFDILNNLENIDSENEYILFSTSPLKNIDNEYFKNIVLDKYKINSKLYSPYWLNVVLREYLIENKFDLFFSPNNLCPINSEKYFPSVITIHDVMFRIDKNYYSVWYRKYLNIFLKKSINTAKEIITISNCSKRDIIKYYNTSPSKISVIYRVADKKFQKYDVNSQYIEKIKRKYRLPEKYLLYVGVIDNRKNIKTILKIADYLYEERDDIKFILVGRPHHGFESLIHEIQRRKNVSYFNYVSDADLPYIYRLAKIFLFPSYYEGFGLPVLEAMQTGIPVISSNTSSIPEVVGNNGIIHDPDDVNAFVKSIKELLNNNTLYDDYCNKSLRNAQLFNINDIVKEHIRIFNKILSH